MDDEPYGFYTTAVTGKPRISPVPHVPEASSIGEAVRSTAKTTGARNMLHTLAHHPQVALRFMQFGTGFLTQGLIGDRHRETIILRTAWACRSPYVWGHHAKIAATCGLTADDLTAITSTTPDTGTFAGRLLTSVDELTSGHDITQDTWNALAADWDDRQMIELVLIVGCFTTLSMLVNSVGVTVEAGYPPFPTPDR